MSIFLRPKWRKKMRSLEANGGRLRPFEAKVKLWVSKFIFFHADSGNGLKHFLNKKVFGLGKRAFGGLSWPLLKCSFQDTYWATYTCLIGMNKLYLGSKNFLLTTSILESASNITFGLSRDRSRPFRHLKFCLKWFQSSYRAYILCEELKLKFFTPQKNFEIVRPQIRGHSRPP